MASTDIYEVKETPWAKNPEPKRRRRSARSFDEAVNPQLAQTHRRRHRNSGFRRLQHLLKRPEFSRRFWLIVISSLGAVIALLIVWDLFFRYPKQGAESTPDYYRAVVE